VGLPRLKRLLAAHRALIPGAAACYAVLFGLLIYGLAVYARLESSRESTAGFHAPASIPQAVPATCAEFAGMGQTPCNAIAKVKVARAEFRPRPVTIIPRDNPPRDAQVKPAPEPLAPVTIAAGRRGVPDADLAPEPPAPVTIAADEAEEIAEEEGGSLTLAVVSSE